MRVDPGFHFWTLLLLFGNILMEQVSGQSSNSNSDDLVCLQSFKAGVVDSSNSLSTWSGPDFPCNTTGITCSSGRVYDLDFSKRGFTGSISPNLSYCGNLNSLDLSSNQISGNIPSELGQLRYLATLKLSENDLDGSIPEEISNCTFLNTIDLHNNQLSGQIPQSLALLTRLVTFDVSNNQLSGPIPSGLANTSNGSPRFNASSFEGNNLYGYPLPPAKSHNLPVLAIVGIGLGSGLLSLCLSFTAVCIWLRVTEQRLAAEEGKISQLVPEY